MQALLSHVETLTSVSGCKTVRAVYQGQPVFCKELCFRTQVAAEKCVSYYRHSQAELKNCRHVASILDVLSGPNYSVWVVFESLTDPLELHMTQRRADRARWTEVEVESLLFPLLADLALLEASKISACFIHPCKLFLRNSACVLSKVSYPIYDRQKAKSGHGFFLSPEFRRLITEDGRLETADFQHNNVFCLGLTMYCLLGGVAPDTLEVSLPAIHQHISALGLSKQFEATLRNMLSSDTALRPGFGALLERGSGQLVQLQLGENVLTLRGIQTVQELNTLVRKALDGDRYDLLDARKEKVQSQHHFQELLTHAAKAGKPLTLEVAAHFQILPEDAS